MLHCHSMDPGGPGFLAIWPKMDPRDLQGAAQKSQHSMQIRVLRPRLARWSQRRPRGLKVPSMAKIGPRFYLNTCLVTHDGLLKVLQLDGCTHDGPKSCSTADAIFERRSKRNPRLVLSWGYLLVSWGLFGLSWDFVGLAWASLGFSWGSLGAVLGSQDRPRWPDIDPRSHLVGFLARQQGPKMA
jgi:hypothetical protein